VQDSNLRPPACKEHRNGKSTSYTECDGLRRTTASSDATIGCMLWDRTWSQMVGDAGRPKIGHILPETKTPRPESGHKREVVLKSSLLQGLIRSPYGSLCRTFRPGVKKLFFALEQTPTKQPNLRLSQDPQIPQRLALTSGQRIRSQGSPYPGTIVVNDTGFSILKYRGQSAVLAVCLRCHLKFFTPSKLMEDGIAAEEYLRKKYDEHSCPAEVAHNEERRKPLQRQRSFFRW